MRITFFTSIEKRSLSKDTWHFLVFFRYPFCDILFLNHYFKKNKLWSAKLIVYFKDLSKLYKTFSLKFVLRQCLNSKNVWMSICQPPRAAILNCRDASRYRDLKTFLPGLEIFCYTSKCAKFTLNKFLIVDFSHWNNIFNWNLSKTNIHLVFLSIET